MYKWKAAQAGTRDQYISSCIFWLEHAFIYFVICALFIFIPTFD
jgi:hypothetical protein